MNINLKIKSGIFDLIESGSFISPNNDRIEFDLINDEAPLSIAFEFSLDEKNKDVRKTTSVKETCLTINFINYKDTRHTTVPWKIGNIYGRELLILYHIDPLNNSTIRKVIYSFYLGKETNNG